MRRLMDGPNPRDRRLMECPVCGHSSESYGIGAVFCGPHITASGHYTKAVQMRTVDLSLAALRPTAPTDGGTES